MTLSRANMKGNATQTLYVLYKPALKRTTGAVPTKQQASSYTYQPSHLLCVMGSLGGSCWIRSPFMRSITRSWFVLLNIASTCGVKRPCKRTFSRSAATRSSGRPSREATLHHTLSLHIRRFKAEEEAMSVYCQQLLNNLQVSSAALGVLRALGLHSHFRKRGTCLFPLRALQDTAETDSAPAGHLRSLIRRLWCSSMKADPRSTEFYLLFLPPHFMGR